MTQKVKVFWKSLDRRIIVSQRELVLGLTVCALAGIVVGAMFTPQEERIHWQQQRQQFRQRHHRVRGHRR